MRLVAPSGACGQALLHLLKAQRLALRMRPTSPSSAQEHDAALYLSPAAVSPSDSEAQHLNDSPAAPDFASLEGSARLQGEEAGRGRAQQTWRPTRLLSRAAQAFCSVPSSATAAVPAVEAEAARDSKQLWSLEIGLLADVGAEDEACGAEGDVHLAHGEGEQGGQAEAVGVDLEDVTKAQGHGNMLSVLSWLLPHAAIGRARQPGMAATAGVAPPLDAAQVYAAVKPTGAEPRFAHDPPELRPRLREYQRRAVAWMLGREGCDGRGQGQGQEGQASGEACQQQWAQGRQQQAGQCSLSGTASEQQHLHPLFRRVDTLGASPFWVNPYTGLVLQKVRWAAARSCLPLTHDASTSLASQTGCL